MRRLLALGAGLILLAGCGTATSVSDDGRPVVLTTFTVLADVASNVAGEHLVVESITRVGAEIHEYQPTPQDVAKASRASLILDNGLGLELWFEQFLHDVDVPHVVVSDGIDILDITADAYAGRPNPHAWMSPVNVSIYVDNMVDAFSELAPEHAEDFRTNGERYQRELAGIHDDLLSELDRLPQDQRALVTCEGAFSYLARDAGLEERYLWPVNAESEATPQRVAAVIEFVTERRIPAVFCESTVSDKAMRQVSAATGARFAGVLYVDSLSGPEGPVPTYLDLIRHDSDLIVSALLAGEATR